MWSTVTDVQWSLLVSWSQPRAVLKQLNQSRFRFRCELWWVQGTIRWALITQGEWTILRASPGPL